MRRKATTPPSAAPSLEQRISQLARAQHGVVTRDQLIAAGLRAGAIDHRLRSGRLHLVHYRVYTLGYPSDAPLTRATAAVLACGSDAALSHRSAAALWEIGVPWHPTMDVTTPSKRHHRGIRHHRARLGAGEVTLHLNISTTTPARTLLDLAATTIDDRALARAFNEARIQHRVQLGDLRRLADATTGHRGLRRIRALLAHDDAPTRSALEDHFLVFLERHALPRPEINQRIAGYEVDALWRSQRLIAELDGRRFHEHHFERDRDKDAALLTAGYRVIRITWQRIARQPEREARRLGALLTTTEPPDQSHPQIEKL